MLWTTRRHFKGAAARTVAGRSRRPAAQRARQTEDACVGRPWAGRACCSCTIRRRCSGARCPAPAAAPCQECGVTNVATTRPPLPVQLAAAAAAAAAADPRLRSLSAGAAAPHGSGGIMYARAMHAAGSRRRQRRARARVRQLRAAQQCCGSGCRAARLPQPPPVPSTQSQHTTLRNTNARGARKQGEQAFESARCSPPTALARAPPRARQRPRLKSGPCRPRLQFQAGQSLFFISSRPYQTASGPLPFPTVSRDLC